MSQGFLPGLLLNAKQVYGGIYPGTKITPKGYLRMLLSQGRPNIVETAIDNNGHSRSATIKYLPRGVAGKSSTVDDCSISGVDPYLEAPVPATQFRKIGVYIGYDEIRKYGVEASQSVRVGLPPPPNGIMQEIWDRMMIKANGMMEDIDQDLLMQQAVNFGKNVNNGLASPRTVNFPKSTMENPLDQGFTMLMQDIMENEIDPSMVTLVGSGLIQGVKLQIDKGTQNTKDQNYPTGGIPNIFWDWNTTNKWGANQFGVFENGSVKFLNINKFSDNFGGNMLTSWLFTLQLPLVDSLGNSELSSFKFDAQLRSIDCKTEVEVDGVVKSVDRGWILDLMANYAQFNIPTDAYDPTDRLTGNNGTLRYVATNV